MIKKILLVVLLVSISSAMINHPHSRVIDSIQTSDDSYPLRFVVYGDNYSINSTFLEFIDYINEHLADSISFVIGVGDFAAGGALIKYQDYLDAIDECEVPFLNVCGNHEVNDDLGEDNFEDLLGPTDYYFDFAGCRFIGIQDCHPASMPDISGEYMRYEITDDQLAWYEPLLDYEGSVFTFMHAPPYLQGHITAGTMGGVGYNPNLAGSNSEDFTDLNKNNDVRAVFCGHLHCYDRWQPSNERYGEVIYFITGGAGAPLNPWPYLAPHGGSFNHFVLMQINGDLSIDGRVYRLGDSPGRDLEYDFHYDAPSLDVVNEYEQPKIRAKTNSKAYLKGDQIYVKFGTPVKIPVSIELYDFNGRLIERKTRRAGIGINKFLFDQPENSGIYLVRIRTKTDHFVKKVNIVH